jgi:hypothetical protein
MMIVSDSATTRLLVNVRRRSPSSVGGANHSGRDAGLSAGESASRLAKVVVSS